MAKGSDNGNGNGLVSQKLRAVMVTAMKKIHTNRFKSVPGKWPAAGFSLLGERIWHTLNTEDLCRKLAEEFCELIIEASLINAGGQEAAVLQEAADVTAVAMMIADNCMSKSSDAIPPKIVCLCGSTRFMKEWNEANLSETLAGNIVLSVGGFLHSDAALRASGLITPEKKVALDVLHKHKIDLADEILVINVGGYIGDSTRSEIEYAIAWGKEIRYLEPLSLQA